MLFLILLFTLLLIYKNKDLFVTSSNYSPERKTLEDEIMNWSNYNYHESKPTKKYTFEKRQIEHFYEGKDDGLYMNDTKIDNEEWIDVKFCNNHIFNSDNGRLLHSKYDPVKNEFISKKNNIGSKFNNYTDVLCQEGKNPVLIDEEMNMIVLNDYSYDIPRDKLGYSILDGGVTIRNDITHQKLDTSNVSNIVNLR